MIIPYSFYSGAGNLFVLIDNRRGTFPYFPELVQRLSFHTTPPADGVIFVEESQTADSRMRIFNRDGSEAAMCGNGLRTFTKFLFDLGIKKSVYSIETKASAHMGLLSAEIVGDDVKTHLGHAHSQKWNLSLDGTEIHFLNTGVPHAISFVDAIEQVDVANWGSKIRHHPLFAPDGTNVTFTQILSPSSIAIRTFERGVEAETQACGTGAAAAAVAAAHQHRLTSPITVHLQSKEKLILSFLEGGRELTLQGPAKKIKSSTFIY